MDSIKRYKLQERITLNSEHVGDSRHHHRKHVVTGTVCDADEENFQRRILIFDDEHTVDVYRLDITVERRWSKPDMHGRV